jgi:hypothetical protein
MAFPPLNGGRTTGFTVLAPESGSQYTLQSEYKPDNRTGGVTRNGA